MTENKNVFQTLKSNILSLTIFLFPLFFLPITQEYFATAKLYLLAFSGLLLLLLTALEILITGKFEFRLKKIELLKTFLLLAVLISLIVSSANKIQALLNPNFGFVALLSLAVLTFYSERSTIVVFKLLSLSGLILSLVTIVFFFQPFRHIPLVFELQFLNNRFFTPMGSQIDLAIFLGFMLVAQLLQLIFFLKPKKNTPLNSFNLLYYPLTTLFTLLALILSLSSLYSGGREPLMPFKYSWFSFIETLKNPLQALVGVGIDNLAAVFTRVKDIAYNQSPLWQIRSFDVSPSSILHIATESGLLGLAAIGAILIWAYKKIVKGERLLWLPLLYLTLILLFFPPSLTVFFIFFLGLASVEDNSSLPAAALAKAGKLLYPPLNSSKFLYFPPAFVLIVLTLTSFFLLSRSYLAEFYFKKSIDALAHSRGRILYDSQRKAILTNPYIERFHLNFSQTNLLLATTLVNTLRVRESSSTLPEGESQAIIQAGQTAIVEAKNAVILNPQKASNWENLALINRNLVNVFTGLDKEVIAAYEKAILLDPQNPQYRLSLGAFYYSQGNFSEAVRSFEQTVVLKPNWANAHYNLAWALYQKQDYQKANQEMLVSISLLHPKKDKVDRDKAEKDLANMKKGAEPEEKISPLLILPTPPVASLEPKLDFSNIATPESE